MSDIETGLKSRIVVNIANWLLRTFTPNYAKLLKATIICGLEWGARDCPNQAFDYAAYEHIAEGGKKRYATVELPNSEGDFCWSIEDVGDIMVGDRGGVVLASGDPVLVMAADEARKFAAALLAAADKAEEGQ